ncbi:MAG: mannose-6-phosphate isomerase, class I [Desulfosarcina sp.]|nr:mannose-6-phosphate isomerase, class I [Desulfobacterales bacterium]
MKNAGLLKNTIQEYGWGSHTHIARLMGNDEPSEKPQAELWMGAHPKAPSRVMIGGKWIGLDALIERDPEGILGKEIAKKFNNRFPYLFKVLAAARPLSIQAHPDILQAKKGFSKENLRGIPLDAPDRNYKDENHKPEIICALTPFWALNGFRRIKDTIYFMERVCGSGLSMEIGYIRKEPDSAGLKKFFNSLMSIKESRCAKIIDEAVSNARNLAENNDVYKWIIKLRDEYPEDIGVLSPVFLNLVCLKPGQAMFLPAGELHAYLEGLGIELMANSDNVLRGGLTSKHIDLPELLNTLNFQERDPDILEPVLRSNNESTYVSGAEEFVLSVITLKEGEKYKSASDRSAEIILCIKGEATLFEAGMEKELILSQGNSVLIPASVEKYSISGDAVFYKAACVGDSFEKVKKVLT